MAPYIFRYSRPSLRPIINTVRHLLSYIHVPFLPLSLDLEAISWCTFNTPLQHCSTLFRNYIHFIFLLFSLLVSLNPCSRHYAFTGTNFSCHSSVHPFINPIHSTPPRIPARSITSFDCISCPKGYSAPSLGPLSNFLQHLFCLCIHHPSHILTRQTSYT